jgi:DNA-binding NarL/FixJ family response regulator
MTPPYKTRVLIVDDHAAVRDGLAAFLEAFDDLVLVAQAASGTEALHLCSWFQPDVVLMDLMMSELDGVTTTSLIRQLYSDIQVIALASSDDKNLIDAALAAGAIGSLHKDVPASELAGAIRAAHAGKPCAVDLKKPNGDGSIVANRSTVNGTSEFNATVQPHRSLPLWRGKNLQDT